MKKLFFTLLCAMPFLTSCTDEDGNLTTLSLFILAIVGALCVFFYAMHITSKSLYWVRGEQLRETRADRFRGRFYDWSCSRQESYSMAMPCESSSLTIPLVIQGICFIAPLCISVLSHGYFVLYCISLIALACMSYTIAFRSACKISNIPKALYLPFLIYVAIKVTSDVIFFIAVLAYALLQTMSSSSSSNTSRSYSSSDNSFSNTSNSQSSSYNSSANIAQSTNNTQSQKDGNDYREINGKKAYRVCYTYKDGGTIQDAKLVPMWFDDVPTRSDVIKYIKALGWGINTDTLVLYHVQFGHGSGWGKNLLES